MFTTLYVFVVLLLATFEFIRWYFFQRGKPTKTLSVFYGIPFIGNEWLYGVLVLIALILIISIILLFKMTRQEQKGGDDDDYATFI